MAAAALEFVVKFWHRTHMDALASIRFPGLETLKFASEGETIDRARLTIAGLVLLLTIVFLSKAVGRKKKNLPPSIPGGLPLVGNILQLVEAKPHRTFTDWAGKYGPIYHIKTGQLSSIVINSADLAREAMVTRFSSISTRRHYTSWTYVTCDKRMVSMGDYNPEHIIMKKAYSSYLLGPNVQKRNRTIRENALRLALDGMFPLFGGKNSAVINVRDCIKEFLFPFNMEQIFGYVPEEIFVPEFGRSVGKCEMYEVLLTKILQAATLLDWRNFFPALSFVPNRSLEKYLQDVVDKRTYIMDALIAKQKKLIETRGAIQCFCDMLLTECKEWTSDPLQLRMSVWEATLVGIDTTLTTIEWAMFEIARNPSIQERLYKEIKSVVGDRMFMEEDIDKLPLLTAVIQETLRVYTPLPVLPPRFVHEDTTIGGYHIPKGSDVLVNLWGVNRDPKVWSNPSKWDPDRVLNDKKIDLGIRDFRIVPFGGGKRICQGIAQAFNVMPMCLASLILHFEWSEPPLTPEERSAAEDTTFATTHKLHPLKAVAKLRVGSRLKYPEATEMSFKDR